MFLNDCNPRRSGPSGKAGPAAVVDVSQDRIALCRPPRAPQSSTTQPVAPGVPRAVCWSRPPPTSTVSYCRRGRLLRWASLVLRLRAGEQLRLLRINLLLSNDALVFQVGQLL